MLVSGVSPVRWISVVPAGLLAAGLIVVPATAQPNVKGFAGSWQLSVGRETCAVQLKTKPMHGAYELVQKCSDAFPMQSVVAWKPIDDGILFVSDTGAPVVTFDEAEELYVDTNDPNLSLRRKHR